MPEATIVTYFFAAMFGAVLASFLVMNMIIMAIKTKEKNYALFVTIVDNNLMKEI